MLLLNENEFTSPTSVYNFFNEAEGDETAAAEPTSDNVDTATIDAPAEENADSVDNDEASENYQMEEDENTEMDMDGEMEGGDTGEEAGIDDSSSGETGDPSEMDTGQPIEDGTKKFILLTQYKELLETVNKLLMNVEVYLDTAEPEKYDDIMYIYNTSKNVSEKMTFSIINKFGSLEYEKLLELFYYFQEEINHLIDLLEKIIET